MSLLLQDGQYMYKIWKYNFVGEMLNIHANETNIPCDFFIVRIKELGVRFVQLMLIQWQTSSSKFLVVSFCKLWTEWNLQWDYGISFPGCHFWYALPLAVILSLLPCFCIKSLKQWIWCSDMNIASEATVLGFIRHQSEPVLAVA